MTVMSPQLKTKPKLGIRLKFDRLMKLVLRFALEKFQKVILEFFKDHSQIFFLNMMIVIGTKCKSAILRKFHKHERLPSAFEVICTLLNSAVCCIAKLKFIV